MTIVQLVPIIFPFSFEETTLGKKKGEGKHIEWMTTRVNGIVMMIKKKRLVLFSGLIDFFFCHSILFFFYFCC